MKYSLAEIGRKDLPILLNLYKRNDLKHYIAYTTIENYIRWIEQDVNDKNVKFFCLNGDFSDGTFVVTVSIKIRIFYLSFREKIMNYYLK